MYSRQRVPILTRPLSAGYIAVQELTKASDIIRSRTFDAFFPLIMTAVLYFCISWLLLFLLDTAERKSELRRTGINVSTPALAGGAREQQLLGG